MRSHHMSRLALAVVVFALLSLLAGCGSTPIYFLYSPPLLYGMEGSDTSLLVIQQNGMYGYADIKGNVLIQPQYTYARPFFEGLAAVQQKSGKFGFIDSKGKVVIPSRYYGAADFHNGKSLVSNRLINIGELNMEKVSVIDKQGMIQKELDYTCASDFSDGVTIVSTYDYKYYMLDEGYDLIETSQIGAETVAFNGFSEGLVISQTSDQLKLSFLDKTGNRAFEAEFADARSFTEGLAPVKFTNDGLWGYINVAGKQAIAPSFRFAGRFGQGLALVEKPDKEWIIIDTSGNEICIAPGSVDITLPFSEGMCAVGRLKKESTYFHSPCPPYKLEYDWGFIDTTGKLVIDYQYDLVTPFKNGIAEVLVDGKIGYIDKTGKYIWEPK